MTQHLCGNKGASLNISFEMGLKLIFIYMKNTILPPKLYYLSGCQKNGYLVKTVKITLIFTKITHILKSTINNSVQTKILILLFPSNTCNFSSFASFTEQFLILEKLLIFSFRNRKKKKNSHLFLLLYSFFFFFFLVHKTKRSSFLQNP